ncbi:hypothetical protein CGLO_13492 [Colletotrichum gloeosporioides Cg-14]|uniref:Uncharacterized protein n=1 Tax=Colletotrichum gloeosporioides (strain Cg-14) TaxID=1237896 RepID=T0K637_COLGC|nr:hypothetical protein CGLO_13492 [Colletotrichum gloeosporioides Cg-14]
MCRVLRRHPLFGIAKEQAGSLPVEEILLINYLQKLRPYLYRMDWGTYRDLTPDAPISAEDIARGAPVAGGFQWGPAILEVPSVRIK